MSWIQVGGGILGREDCGHILSSLLGNVQGCECYYMCVGWGVMGSVV